MPHVIVKLYPGRSEQQKRKIAEDITAAIMASADCAEPSVSVSIEDVKPEDWIETVYKPEIVGKWDHVYKKPGVRPALKRSRSSSPSWIEGDPYV